MTPEEKIETTCPKCGKPLSDIVTTPTGRKLQRCSSGIWNPDTKKTDGCDYVKWFTVPPQELAEKCPKCGASLVLAVTRFGKKMKKCSTGSWDKLTRTTMGCDYVEWINGTTEALSEECPECGKSLVLYTTANGKKMKKCSTSGWDKVNKVATGCTYVYWLKPGEYPKSEIPANDTGEEFLPPEE